MGYTNNCRFLQTYVSEDNHDVPYVDGNIYYGPCETVYGHSHSRASTIFKGTDDYYYATVFAGNSTPIFKDMIPSYSVTITTSGWNGYGDWSIDDKYYLTQSMIDFKDHHQYYLHNLSTHDYCPMLFYNDLDSKWTFGIPPYCRKYVNFTGGDTFKYKPIWKNYENFSYTFSSTPEFIDVSVYSFLDYKGIWTNSTIVGDYSLNYTQENQIKLMATDSSSTTTVTDIYYPTTMNISNITLSDFVSAATSGYILSNAYILKSNKKQLYGEYTGLDDSTNKLYVGVRSYYFDMNISGETVTRPCKDVKLAGQEYVDHIDHYNMNSVTVDDKQQFFLDRDVWNSSGLIHEHGSDDGWVTDGWFDYYNTTGVITGYYGTVTGDSSSEYGFVSSNTDMGNMITVYLSGFDVPYFEQETVLINNPVIFTNKNDNKYTSSFTPNMTTPDLTDKRYWSYLHDIIGRLYLSVFRKPYYDLVDITDQNTDIEGRPIIWGNKPMETAILALKKIVPATIYKNSSGQRRWMSNTIQNLTKNLSDIEVTFDTYDFMKFKDQYDQFTDCILYNLSHTSSINSTLNVQLYKNIVNYVKDIDTLFFYQASFGGYNYYHGSFSVPSQVRVGSSTINGPSGTSISDAYTKLKSECLNHELWNQDTYENISNVNRITHYDSPNRYYYTCKSQFYYQSWPLGNMMYGLGQYPTNIENIAYTYLAQSNTTVFKHSTFGLSEPNSGWFDNTDGIVTDNTDCFIGYAYPPNSAEDGVMENPFPLNNVVTTVDVDGVKYEINDFHQVMFNPVSGDTQNYKRQGPVKYDIDIENMNSIFV